MYWLGLDFGTSGARACLLDERGNPVWQQAVAWNGDAMSPDSWSQALAALLSALPAGHAGRLAAIALDATSGTALLVGNGQEILSPVLPYSLALPDIAARLAWLAQQRDMEAPARLVHQADWLNTLLLGQPAPSDWHNALKSGFDPQQLAWSDTARENPAGIILPEVVEPGSTLGTIDRQLANRHGIHRECRIVAGTTDSIAATLAAGPGAPGEAVTSLGSTLALKLVSPQPVRDPASGVYSHRLGNVWLAAGASNSGGAVLRQYFSDAELKRLSAAIDPQRDSPFDYYPLPSDGERFPYFDPQRQSRVTPRPADPVAFLHALLQGIARIEVAGYARLAALGAPMLLRVATAGGGSANPQWQALRQRLLGVPVERALNSEAACGSAWLALNGTIRL